MSDHVFQNQYRMLYLSPRGTGHVDNQSLQNSQWDFKYLSTRYSKYLVKKQTKNKQKNNNKKKQNKKTKQKTTTKKQQQQKNNSPPQKKKHIVISICIIQLLTIQALDMMCYPPDCHEHFLIAGYPGRRQSKTTVIDDERGSISLRNSATGNRKRYL